MVFPHPVRRVRAVLAMCFLVVAIAVACTGPARHGSPLWRTELVFGLNRPGGDTVSAAEWQAFVDTCLAPSFRSGYTLIDAQGQWMNADGVVERERSKVVLLVHPDDDHVEEKIERVRELYRTAFRQESVLRISLPVQASF